MAELETIPVVVGIGGAVLIWSAIRNKHPIEAVKLVLQGQDPNSAKPISTFVLGSQSTPGAVPSETLPGTPAPGDDARTDPPGFKPGPNEYVVPILPGEGQPSGGVY